MKSSLPALQRREIQASVDSDCLFVWMSAPAEATLFWFEAPGFKPRRHVLLKAEGAPHEIKLEH